MSLIYRDYYLKNYPKIKTKNHQWLGIIRSYGELSEKLNFGDYIIEPYDIDREFTKGTEAYQRLKITINHAEPEEAKMWNSQLINNEICSLLCLASGRKIIDQSEYLLEINTEYKLKSNEKIILKNHPNLLAPIEHEKVQELLDILWSSIKNITTQESYEKLCTLIKAIHLYQGSLEIIEDNYEAAYVLLISSAETIAEKFSSVSPTREDLPQKNKITEFFEKHNLGIDLEEELLNILFQPNHIKLRAKFVDVILSNLDKDFFNNPPIRYILTTDGSKTEEGKYLPTGFMARPDDTWNFKESEDEIKKLLKNIYDCRSQFVHSGKEFPMISKHLSISSGIVPIKTNENGKAKKNKEGNYIKEKKVLPYFTFERIMNNVLINLFDKL